MKLRHSIFLISLSLILILSSCLSNKKLTYLQYAGRIDNVTPPVVEARPTLTPPAYKIMPYDILFIRVITPDPQWSAIFNPSLGSGGSLTEESAALSGYNVDGDGYIEIPYVGRVGVAGKTLAEIKIELDMIFKKYVSDGSITVRMVNNFVSVIGEVRAPGRYPLTRDRINVFDALSLAGDLNDYSNRQKLQLIRQTPYGPLVKEFSIRDRSILTSEFYYIMPNDIIYAQPMRGRSFMPNTSVYTLFLSSITTFLVIFSFFRTGGL